MLQKVRTYSRKISPGAAASALAHAIIAAVLIFGLPDLSRDADEPQVIPVELVLSQQDILAALQQTLEETVPPPSGQEEVASSDPAGGQPIRTLFPVYQFGEEDAGPSETIDGDTPEVSETTETQSEDTPSEEPDVAEQTADLDEAPTAEQAEETAAADAPQPPEETAETERSVHDTESAVATSAKNDIPRGVRAGDLCATELRRQLVASIPPYRPNLLPAYRLDEGTLIVVQKGAFRSDAQWYDLKFRCEIDEEATRVVSFDFEVGAPIPRSAWADRGLPAS
ncbi:DUF930 domain-containing protein [Hoeflea prorocentri]|uniref:DUF930 domain-containing protein n=1 Tax=Hoeflea prorocentri TaxID=1922333 RepID=A0A9X3ZI40_9HYPH|nr:DUF930 domain-containing protein [Hoeflea prorocentri]MCY6382527.1 DUF930 domain-containing protein [Hoeflea prorocentri]MDA5400327.1 DUF930 domain-containing protein [Hoeflea prorocentri]